MPHVRTFLFAAALALLPGIATAEPVTLKLSYFGSLDSETYRFGIKPFVDGVNADGQGTLAVEVHPNSELGSLAEQPQLLLTGKADIAFVVPGQTPYRFPDTEILEIPGLFRDLREGTLAYTRLIVANALRGYGDFFVIGAYTAAPSIITSRKPIATIADLQGVKLRTNNPPGAEALDQLGAIPTIMAAPRLAEAMSRGVIDGAVISPLAAFQFGPAQLATNHYLLEIGVAPLALLMNRKSFDALPETAKAVIRNHSGERAAKIWIDTFGAEEKRILERLKSDPKRRTVEPSPADFAIAQRVFRSMIDACMQRSTRNREILNLIRASNEEVRSTR